MAAKLCKPRWLARVWKFGCSPATSLYRCAFLSCPDNSRLPLGLLETLHGFKYLHLSRSFCSRPFDLVDDHSQGPAAVNYHSLLLEDEFHRIADSTMHALEEKLEEYGDSVQINDFDEYGDSVQIDDFDVDYANDVLTMKVGELGTYVLNKQSPNRQLWLSSPVSGPSRFDWDQHSQSWIYRRQKTNLVQLLETELKQLCGSFLELEPLNCFEKLQLLQSVYDGLGESINAMTM